MPAPQRRLGRRQRKDAQHEGRAAADPEQRHARRVDVERPHTHGRERRTSRQAESACETKEQRRSAHE
jgi:hypothetical protein